MGGWIRGFTNIRHSYNKDQDYIHLASKFRLPSPAISLMTIIIHLVLKLFWFGRAERNAVRDSRIYYYGILNSTDFLYKYDIYFTGIVILCTVTFVIFFFSFSHTRINSKSIFCTIIELCEEHVSDIASWLILQLQFITILLQLNTHIPLTKWQHLWINNSAQNRKINFEFDRKGNFGKKIWHVLLCLK